MRRIYRTCLPALLLWAVATGGSAAGRAPLPDACVSGFVSASDSARMAAAASGLPVWESNVSERTSFDWLLTPERSSAKVYRTADGKGLVLANAMVAREFRLWPALATTAFVNRMTGESLLRAVSGEGTFWVNGRAHDVGGLAGQPERGYLLPQWIDDMRPLPEAFVLEDFSVERMADDMKWKPTRWALDSTVAGGVQLSFKLHGTGHAEGLQVVVRVGLYDELPVFRKEMELYNLTADAVVVDSFCVERLAFVEGESPSGGDPSRFRLPNVHVESDYNCGGSFTEPETDITEHWNTDTAYTSQRNYLLQTPCMLEVTPPLGPDQHVPAGGSLRTFRVYEMPFDSDDRERKGLFLRRFYRGIAPWTTQNPIFMHLTSSDSLDIRRAVDQCAATGYEMIIISFGSGLNAEDISEKNIRKYRDLADYAHSRGIELGCYSLLASRSVNDSVDAISPATGKPGGMTFGNSPCLCSDWGYDYFERIQTFLERTGMTCFENDGSYPGDVCASTRHAHHRGLRDSQWNQFYKIANFYRRLCRQGVYLNVPDFYYLNGSTKVSIGYREVNWSLPRDRQIMHTRQLNYDCTWERPVTGLWSFVPLTQYHGGGAAATLEPLAEHLWEYRTLMFQNYSSGVQACYRGRRLYDTPATRDAVAEIVSWYKQHRRILNSDIIHLRRPDGVDWDGLMHVDPWGKERALAVFYNPTDKPMERTVSLPLYYSGLKNKASIRFGDGPARSYQLDADGNALVKVNIPARGYVWCVAE